MAPTHQLVLPLIALFFCLASDLAHARKKTHVPESDEYINKQLPDNGTVWHCWWDGAETIQCKLGESSSDLQVLAAAQVKVTTDSRLPPLVHQIWDKPDTVNRQITIPLGSVPYDMAFTGELAESVMCSGSKIPCGIIFGRNTRELAQAVIQRTQQLAARTINAANMLAANIGMPAPHL
jgi:hypothetical protein